MALNLVELYLNVTSPESAKTALGAAQRLAADQFPPGVRRVAGPWVSNEETKLVVVLDIQDPASTVAPFWGALASGLVKKRRFTPLVELEQVQTAVDAL